MTDPNRERLERRVLVVAPTGKDAHLTAAILHEAGIDCDSFPDMPTLARALEDGGGAVLATEESLYNGQQQVLTASLGKQPPWSDVPILVLTRPGANSGIVSQALLTMGNVTLLERPTRVTTLVSAVQAALRGRRRQYQLRDREERLAEELDTITQLHALSMRLTSASDLQNALEEVLDASMQIMHADFGTIQLHDPATRTLEIKTQRGFIPEFLEHFRRVRLDDGSCCGRALAGERAIIEDTEKDAGFEPHREIARLAGVRAVQSTPLVSRSGELLGVLSTHFRRPHRPSERDLRIIDLYARQVADFWDDLRSHETLRHSESELSEFFENANVGLHWAGPDGVIQRVNQAELDMLGYRREEYVGHHIAEFHADRAVIDDILKRLAAGEKLQGYAARLRAKDGSVKQVLINSSVLWERGKFVHTRCFTLDVTEKKRVEEQLQASQEQLALALAGSGAAIWGWDVANNRLDEWTPEYRRLYGFTMEEPAAFEIWVTRLHPDDRERLLERIKQIIETPGDDDFNEEFRILHPEAGQRWIAGLGKCFRDEAGRALRMAGVNLDISARKWVEQELRESRDVLSLAMRGGRMGAWSRDMATDEVWWSRELEEIFGLEPGGFAGTEAGFLAFVHPDDRAVLEQAVASAVAQQKDYLVEFRFRHATGEWRWMEGRGRAVYGAVGQPVTLYGLGIDITERKRFEDALQRGATRARLLWEAASVLLSTEEPDLMMRSLFAKIAPHFELDTYFNFMVDKTGEGLRLLSYSGIPAEEAQGIGRLEFGQAICGNVALRCEPILATHIQQSHDPKVELVKAYGIRAYICHPLISRGQLLGTLSFASRQRDSFDADEVDFFKTICHYVTVAYERARLVRELRESHRRKDEFLATLAHELRNPLAPIHNALYILRRESNEIPAIAHLCEMIQRQTNYMVRLVDDLMEVSRITRGKIELRKERVELASILRNALETSQPLIDAAGHKLHLSLPPEPLFLEGDAVRLGQIFANLLNNAAKYTEPGGEIWLSAQRQSNGVSIFVRDTGIGIPPDMLPRVFEIFTQVDRSPGRAQGGLGIGLTLVRSLAEMHGGEVEARSAGNGHGSEFIVRLPLAPEVRAAEPKRVEHKPASVLSARRVVVADDNRDAADSLGTLLKILGAEVKVVYDGPSALEAFRTYRPAVMLLDIGMPGMDGYEVARRIHQEPESGDVTLIALTGWSQEEDRRQSQTAGFDHHLVKPADVSVLQALLVSLEGSSQTKH